MATIDSDVHSGTPGAWPYPKALGTMQVVPTGATTAKTLADIAAHGIRATATLATATVNAGTTGTQNITVAGSAAGAEVAVGGPTTLEAGLVLFAYVSVAGTVTLRISNVTAGNITPAGSQTVSVRVFNPPA